jgi:TatD DNase family protein
MYIDSHSHLDSDRFADDLDEVLKRAERAGVRKILSIATLTQDLSGFERTLEVIREHPARVSGAVGIHPHDAGQYGEGLEKLLLAGMEHQGIVAWGEIGLDYHYDFSPRDEQRRVFRRQLQLARRLGKPVIIHSRESDEDICAILEEELNGIETPAGVMHCFSSDAATAQRCLDIGMFISFGGILSFRNAQAIREVAASVPLDRLLIETDSPYLAPEPFRGRRNEPAYVVRVAEVLAQIRGIEPEEIGVATSENCRRLFGL